MIEGKVILDQSEGTYRKIVREIRRPAQSFLGAENDGTTEVRSERRAFGSFDDLHLTEVFQIEGFNGRKTRTVCHGNIVVIESKLVRAEKGTGADTSNGNSIGVQGAGKYEYPRNLVEGGSQFYRTVVLKYLGRNHFRGYNASGIFGL